MTERKEIQLPPSWCGSICKNAMNEICVESCAIKRDCSGFDPKPDIELAKLPRFPLEETQEMSKEEKFTVVTIYLSAITDHLKGEPNEPKPVFRRPNLNRTASSQVSPDKQSESLLSGETEEVTLFPPPAKREDTHVRSEKMAQGDE